jgi:hypothetical protein
MERGRDESGNSETEKGFSHSVLIFGRVRQMG